MPELLVPAAVAEAELVDRKSRFLAQIHPVHDVEQAAEIIRTVRAAHPHARHTCTALVVEADEHGAPVQRSNDDGEPAGTAGMPMLQVLLTAGMTDALAVVTRYFGGVKLGTGGLQRAYSGAVQAALDSTPMLRRVSWERVTLDVDPAEAGAAEHQLRTLLAPVEGMVEPTEYGATQVRLRAVMPPSAVDQVAADLATASSGRLTLSRIGAVTLDVPAGVRASTDPPRT
ncbi:YigZ family protein [Brachybacterium sp. EF45031]|uniref:IMPACT family protein n=1 Tax=Brachybacterium sillae TaxID=2810536 RepID=UPI00217E3922|nr:YigZ family protein [Brachybacterium sillae]MCS6712243.1 YigZ family protein [Brachybacterium sillae]